jgi:hypothetical protein
MMAFGHDIQGVENSLHSYFIGEMELVGILCWGDSLA